MLSPKMNFNEGEGLEGSDHDQVDEDQQS